MTVGIVIYFIVVSIAKINIYKSYSVVSMLSMAALGIFGLTCCAVTTFSVGRDC